MSEVVSATPMSTLGLVPNRLRIVRGDGSVVDFVPPGRRESVEAVERVRRGT